MAKTKTLTINRGKWLTGKALNLVGDGTLLHESGLMCCLGFECIKNGESAATCRGKALPSNIGYFGDDKWLLKRVGGYNAESELASTNDDRELKPRQRESRIRKLFKEHGDITVRFTGKYADGIKRAKAWVKKLEAAA
nr:MetaGeneMark_Unknown Function [uncultured bacterium]